MHTHCPVRYSFCNLYLDLHHLVRPCPAPSAVVLCDLQFRAVYLICGERGVILAMKQQKHHAGLSAVCCLADEWTSGTLHWALFSRR